MKRDGLESEYDRVRRRSGFKKFEEFPEDDPVDIKRVDAAHADFKARMAELNRAEAEAAARTKAMADEFTAGANERIRLGQFAAAGVAPPDGMRVSLPLLLLLGWRIEEVGGHRSLVRPTKGKESL